MYLHSAQFRLSNEPATEVALDNNWPVFVCYVLLKLKKYDFLHNDMKWYEMQGSTVNGHPLLWQPFHNFLVIKQIK